MGSNEAATWVSAVAAVVQAIGAVIAIVYSGKLARDSAKREDAARIAAAEREEEADARAEARIEAARAAAEEDRIESERIRHNEPINLALGFAKSAYSQLEIQLSHQRSAAARGEKSQSYMPVVEGQSLLAAQSNTLAERCTDAESAAAVMAVAKSFFPSVPSAIGTAAELAEALNQTLNAAGLAMERLERQLWRADGE